MLALSILQAPIDRRLVAAARRLGQVQAAPRRALSERLVPVLALAIVALVGLGMQPAVLAPYVGPGVLRVGVVLVAGGVVATVFAGSALKLAAGVLIALIGSEAIYASLDPGLLVTGGLAGLQLLFTIVASFFIGQSPLVGGPEGQPRRDDVARVQPEVV